MKVKVQRKITSSEKPQVPDLNNWDVLGFITIGFIVGFITGMGAAAQ